MNNYELKKDSNGVIFVKEISAENNVRILFGDWNTSAAVSNYRKKNLEVIDIMLNGIWHVVPTRYRATSSCEIGARWLISESGRISPAKDEIVFDIVEGIMRKNETPNPQITELEQRILTGQCNIKQVNFFGGAGLKITDDVLWRKKDADIVMVYTKFATELSWVVYELKAIYSKELNSMNKYTFYPALGYAANRAIESGKDLIDIKLAMIAAARCEARNFKVESVVETS